MRKTAPAAADAKWVISINEELVHESKHDVRPSITRVPAPLHVVRKSAFTPQTLAIGPFHRKLGQEGFYAFSFAAMEESKIEAAKILCARSASGYHVAGVQAARAPLLEELVQEVAREEEKVRSCYGREMGLADLTTQNLGYMLGLDCLFIVAFMHSFYNDQLLHAAHINAANPQDAWWAPWYYERFSPPLKKAVMLDLLLLENQVPFFLLEKAMHMVYGEDVEQCFQDLVDTMAYKTLPFCKEVKGVGRQDAKHLLDCLYAIVTHSDNSTHNQSHGSFHSSDGLLQDDDDLQHTSQLVHVPTATKLHEAGVQFEGHQQSLNNVNFKGNTLTLPAIHVGDETECIFRNLLAHEAQLVNRADVVSYLHFMNSLINTNHDVELLVEAGVITESIGDYKLVARLWNELATNTMCNFTSQYNRAARLAIAYKAQEIHGMIAELRERYFSRPWLLLSLLSGAALLVMNFITMWYTIEVYIKG